MDIHKWFPAQEPTPEELDAAFEDTTTNLYRRISDMEEPGIIPASKLFAETGDSRWDLIGDFEVTRSMDRPLGVALGIDVGAGLAYDTLNQRINIPAGAQETYDLAKTTQTDSLGNVIPKSTGNWGLALPANSTVHVYIQYLSATNTTTPGSAEVGGPAAPVNNYTVDPDTGQVDYVARIDGYKLYYTYDAGNPNTPPVSANPDDVYLATVVSTAQVDTIITDGTAPGLPRTVAGISAALVQAVTPAGAGDIPATYASSQEITLADHVKAVADVTAIAPANPHGTTMAAIPGLNERFGPYSDNPDNFTASCIIDTSQDPTNTGPFYCTMVAPLGALAIDVQLPSSLQYAYLDGQDFTSDATFYSEVQDVNHITEQINAGEMICQFPDGNLDRPTGFYYIALQRFSPVGTPAGLLAHAFTSATLQAMSPLTSSDMEQVLLLELLDGTPLIDQQTYIPLAVVHFNADAGGPGIGAFTELTDPQTGLGGVGSGVYVIDVRRFGHINNDQIAHERRHYAILGEELSTDVVNLGHNLRLVKRNIEMYGGASAGADGGNIKITRGTLEFDNSFVMGADANVTIKNPLDAADFATVFLPGEIKMYGGATAPDGWLFCDGSTKDQATYARLYAVVSSLYNNGSEPAGHFRLPDLCGRVPVGAGTSAAGGTLTPRTLASSGGEETHLLTYQESGLPDHTHSYNDESSTDGAAGGPYATHPTSFLTSGVTGGPQNASQAHNTMPPFLAVNYIIKT